MKNPLIIAFWGLLFFPNIINAQTHAGTLSIDTWSPKEGKTGPSISSLTLKWQLQSSSDKLEANFNMQWYLGSEYHGKKDTFPMENVPMETQKLLSITTLVLEAEVWQAQKQLAIMRVDMGATPPHGGLWGEKVSVLKERKKFLLL